jgi:hypothetical protein
MVASGLARQSFSKPRPMFSQRAVGPPDGRPPISFRARCPRRQLQSMVACAVVQLGAHTARSIPTVMQLAPPLRQQMASSPVVGSLADSPQIAGLAVLDWRGIGSLASRSRIEADITSQRPLIVGIWQTYRKTNFDRFFGWRPSGPKQAARSASPVTLRRIGLLPSTSGLAWSLASSLSPRRNRPSVWSPLVCQRSPEEPHSAWRTTSI